MKLWPKQWCRSEVDLDAVDENGTPLWWIGHRSRKWFEIYKRIRDLEKRLEALEDPHTMSSPEIAEVVRLDPGESGKWVAPAGGPTAFRVCEG